MRLHCTKKLYDYLAPNYQAALPAERGCIGIEDWHANVITIDRKKHLIFIHDLSRYCVFIPSIKKSDMKNLGAMFEDVFLNSLIKIGATEEDLQVAKAGLAVIEVDRNCDRSVQGTMNRIAEEVIWTVQYRELPLDQITGYGLSAQLGDRPCTVKGEKDAIWPGKRMLTLLRAYD